MSLPVRDQLKYWGIAALVTAAVMWFLGDVLLPFVLGAAVAYFLDPVADRMEKMGLSRVAATALITIVAIVVFFIMILSVVPTLIEQTIALFNTAPQALQDLQNFLSERFPSLLDGESAARRTMASIGATIQEKGGALLETALNSAASLVDIVVLLVIVPVVAFYLLLDWDRLVARVDELLPRDHAPTVRKIASDIDHTLSAFVRGMGSVCLILGTFYAVSLMAVGLNFGLVVGAVAGILTFIPYVGALVGGGLAIGLALFQFWGDWVSIGLVAGIFIVGQVLEGNVLTPKLVGDSVGLHPVTLIMALSVFGALFGFIGMLVAVPVAASIGVITRYLVGQYKTSRLYLGVSGQTDD